MRKFVLLVYYEGKLLAAINHKGFGEFYQISPMLDEYSTQYDIPRDRLTGTFIEVVDLQCYPQS